MLHEFNLEAVNVQFDAKNVQERIESAHEYFGDGLVLSCSFGIQSLLLLMYVNDSGLNIPVVTIDVDGDEYNVQRLYRDKLQQELEVDLHIGYAKREEDKSSVMDDMLKKYGATALMSGIRAVQTENRSTKGFFEQGAQGEVVRIHPILDWSDAKTDHYLMKLPGYLRHPEYSAGVQSKGGLVLGDGENKTECGLHI